MARPISPAQRRFLECLLHDGRAPTDISRRELWGLTRRGFIIDLRGAISITAAGRLVALGGRPPAAEGTLRCCACKGTLPAARFCLDPNTTSGRSHRCKSCDVQWRKARRETEHGRAIIEGKWRRQVAKQSADPVYRAKNRERSRRDRPKFREASRERSALYRAQFPEKAAARNAVNRAVRAGRLVRPDHCEACGALDAKGADGRSLIHAHHHCGYQDPLRVTWVCSICHAAEHLAERRAARSAPQTTEDPNA